LEEEAEVEDGSDNDAMIALWQKLMITRFSNAIRPLKDGGASSKLKLRRRHLSGIEAASWYMIMRG